MNVIYFIILIGVLIFVHETGHFVFAKLFGVKVLKFSLGFGPRIVGIQRKETEYAVSWIPLGGYVKMLGESPDEQVAPEERHRSFDGKPVWQRVLIVLAGPAFNLLFPLLLYFVLFAVHHTQLPAEVGKVYAGLPAARAGLLPGDRIVAVNGSKVDSWDALRRDLSGHAGQRVELTVDRAGHRLDIALTPEARVQRNELGLVERSGIVGISPSTDLAQIGISDPGSPAARAGLRSWDVITSVNGSPVASWRELQQRLAATRAATLRLSYVRPPRSAGAAELRALPHHDAVIQASGAASGPAELGLRSADLFVAEVEPGSPAARIGLRRGDRVVRVDGRPAQSWETMLIALERQPTATHSIAWVRAGGAEQRASFKLALTTTTDRFKQKEQHYSFGARNQMLSRTPPPVPVDHPFRYAVAKSFQTTGQLIGMIALTVVRLFEGKMPGSSVGGPLMLYYTAGEAARLGWSTFVSVMALISINLGILNLFPIPILDGGHLLFFGIEAIRRRPLSARARQVATSIGLMLILALVVFAFRNDIARYWIK